MILVKNIRLALGAGSVVAKERALAMLRLSAEKVKEIEIAKVSVDARHSTPTLVYTVAVSLKETKDESKYASEQFTLAQKPQLVLPKCAQPKLRPIVCGFGPAGIFSALILARCGLRPIVLERGQEMDDRVKSVNSFYETGILNANSNIQFGEGGAGTFSDGKLTTRIGNDLCEFVKDVLLLHGAPKEIMYKQKPHIGTDLLRNIIKNIRQEIIDLGGEIRFNTQLTEVCVKNGEICKIGTNNGEIECSSLILAIGHSARDTFSVLQNAGFTLKCKPFSVGARIEHLQSEINNSLYHSAVGHPELPQGEYALSAHIKDRCVYTFCMCPGGSVVAAASELGGVVTNGMSTHARDGLNANAAIAVSLSEKDFDGDAKKAIEFQARLEKAAYDFAGQNYKAPCQDMQNFMQGTNKLNIGKVLPSYPLGVSGASLQDILGKELSETMRAGLKLFNNKIKGFTCNDALLTGVETRTSSPIRIERGEDGQSIFAKGVYPTGEGAGYAGGIMSAAVDGIKSALSLIDNVKVSNN